MTTVADAIRSKTGGAEPLSFPTGFSEAIGGITTGGGDPAYEALGRLMSQSFALTSPNGYDFAMSDISEALPKVSGVPYIWSHMFYNRQIGDVNWEGFTGSLDSFAFTYATFWKEFSVPSGVLISGERMFDHAKQIPGYPLSGSVTTVPSNMFAYATFTENIVVPEGVTILETGSFSDVNRNTSDMLVITLPSTLTTIRGSYGTISGGAAKTFDLVMLAQTPPQLVGTNTLLRVNSITVPAGTLTAYQEATNWSQFADIMVEASA